MKSNIFIPKKIKVGFQNRSDTYTKKLAYVIYYDNKNKLRKETSWNGWRDKKIEPIEFNNEPISGFVLNKKAGDYSSGWNHRQAYTRVYDPRDFEFEITIENLLYILENTNSIKGKGLEGKFIYGWDGKDLLLIPVESPDYKEITKFNDVVHNNKSIKAKELIIGATYKTKENQEWVYMGKYDYHGWKNNRQKHFWFYNLSNDNYYWSKFQQLKTLSGNKLIELVDGNCYFDYAKLFDEMECYEYYSPIDENRIEYEEYDLKDFRNILKEKILDNSYWWAKIHIYSDCLDKNNEEITI